MGSRTVVRLSLFVKTTNFVQLVRHVGFSILTCEDNGAVWNGRAEVSCRLSLHNWAERRMAHVAAWSLHLKKVFSDGKEKKR